MQRVQLCAALLLSACTGEKDSDAPVTLAEVQDVVFTPSCAFATCHAAPGESGLVLEEGASLAALVNVDSVDNPGNILVIPGDSEASYLIAKLRGDAGIVGELMPVGAALEADRLQLVVDWINTGATE